MGKKIALLNNGCAKNLVDSEVMLGILAENGYEITLDESKAQIVIINTCSFIHDAQKESIRDILSQVEKGKKVIVTGCLAQRYKLELKKEIPQIVAMLGPSDLCKIVDVVKNVESAETQNTLDSCRFCYEVSERPQYIYPEMVQRQQITVGASSYIKIADGCNAKCGYCIIPQLRGSYHSRKIEDIVFEAKTLVQKGVNEIILIAQDTTSYGIDLYSKPSLSRLLKELDKIDNLSWIRIMYTYPSFIDDELIDTIQKSNKILNYIDMPLQHLNPQVLKNMNRPVIDYENLISKLRANLKDVALRTTFIVGYPTETDEQFEDLCEKVKLLKFDRLGVFTFSLEENTYASHLPDQVNEQTKQYRKDRLMQIQQKISKQINQSFVGRSIDCIIEAIDEQNNLVIARSFRDAPEIDGLVYIHSTRKLVPGDIEQVFIEKADEYDLFGICT